MKFLVRFGAPQLPAFSMEDTRRFHRLQAVRIVLAIVFTLIVSKLLSISLASEILAGAAVIGILSAGKLLRRGWSFPLAFLGHALLFALGYFVLSQWNAFSASPDPRSDFRVAIVADSALLITVWYSLAFVSTWFFWCRDWAVTVEGAVFSFLLIWMMSGHRNYHLDAPKQVSSLSWKIALLQQLHAEPQHLFLILAAVATSVLVLYCVLSAKRPFFRGERFERSPGKLRVIYGSLVVLIAIFSLGTYTYYVNKRYSQDISRAMQGVAMPQNQEGQSNLGFHSAMGATKQPAALVRLEGDYPKNPYAPMLYFRDGALSQFTGRDYVLAGPQFDTDVPRTRPGQPYIAMTDALSVRIDEATVDFWRILLEDRFPYSMHESEDELSITGATSDIATFDLLLDDVVMQLPLPGPQIPRQQIAQSVFLLTEHTSSFAVDYPSRIGLIRNPDAHRFTLAYQAVSQAPTVPNQELAGRSVGNPLWTKEVREHYLRAPGSRTLLTRELPGDLESAETKSALDKYGEDLRYLAFSRRLTAGLSEPIEKALAILQYLSENSVYTRKPGHTVGANADPVAPYLFADKKRGYCVHFAHAAVYLLRLAGIPARIGTGYLTDLQYAKDGHILLSLADRHAWPEIYVDGYGWIVFDINPAQAENEQAPVPDEKLLEDLMNKLDSIGELTPPETTSATPSEEGESLFAGLLNRRLLFFMVSVLLLTFLSLKLWLRFGYILVFTPRDRIARSYSSFASQMFDLGMGRLPGETRFEHSKRMRSKLEIEADPLAGLLQEITYGEQERPAGIENIGDARKQFRDSLSKRVPLWRRVVSFFNPASLSRIGRW